MMWLSILFKIAFTIALWFWALPSSSGQGMRVLFIKWFLLLIVCGALEVIASSQLQMFSLHHIAHHPPLVVWGNLVAYLSISLISSAIYFTRQSFRNERQRRAMMETQLTTELNFLHAQLNPHFLFNTLNNLFSIAQQSRNDELATAISRLSGLMRYMIYDSKAVRVSLQMEISHLRDFIGLASMRYSKDEVVTTLEIEGDTSRAMIAPMILLPFVENAFKHGVRIEERSTIVIRIHVGSKQIRFSCINKKKVGNIPTDPSGIGLENVKRRLQLLYTDKHKLDITEQGDSFEVRLSLEI